MNHSLKWPIQPADLLRVGQSVLLDRDGSGRPHKGIDLFVEAGTAVRAAQGGRVLRAVDGRGSDRMGRRRAGLFVDVRGTDQLIYRYIHLGEVFVGAADEVEPGTVLGTVAEPFTSGLREAPHLHFEIRRGDWSAETDDYGIPIDPLSQLPSRRA